MNKAILIIDMPSECGECPLLYDYLRCQAKEGVDIYGEKRPGNCPLKPLPKPKEITFKRYEDVSTKLGYNSCLSEILGGNDNES